MGLHSLPFLGPMLGMRTRQALFDTRGEGSRNMSVIAKRFLATVTKADTILPYVMYIYSIKQKFSTNKYN